MPYIAPALKQDLIIQLVDSTGATVATVTRRPPSCGNWWSVAAYKSLYAAIESWRAYGVDGGYARLETGELLAYA